MAEAVEPQEVGPGAAPRWRGMAVIGIPLSPGKGRWPKSEKKRAMRRYQLTAAAEYKKAISRGSFGAASKVRRIDPATGEEIIDPFSG